MMSKELRKLIDTGTDHMMTASRIAVMSGEAEKEEIFEYIAQTGQKNFEKVFSMSEDEFMLKVSMEALRIALGRSEE